MNCWSIKELFGDEGEGKRFAVRSSAVGEDGEELSSAGQNATVLGCKGFDAIKKGLQECWASLLSFQSVEYRRQHGEPLIPGTKATLLFFFDQFAKCFTFK